MLFYPTRYRWEFDGMALPDDPRITVVDGVLTIQTPQVSDEGDYQCFATNKHGTALSSKYQAIYACKYHTCKQNILTFNSPNNKSFRMMMTFMLACIHVTPLLIKISEKLLQLIFWGGRSKVSKP